MVDLIKFHLDLTVHLNFVSKGKFLHTQVSFTNACNCLENVVCVFVCLLPRHCMKHFLCVCLHPFNNVYDGCYKSITVFIPRRSENVKSSKYTVNLLAL